jgi:hypothetical protein
MSQRTNYGIKMYAFKSYLFIDGKKCSHTKYDKLGYHPIHYIHDTDYWIYFRNKTEYGNGQTIK